MTAALLQTFDAVANGLAVSLAAETGQPWELDTDTLIGSAGAELWLGLIDSRLEISGQCGDAREYLRRGEGPFVITVSAHRTPAAIAKDIAKRLLPRYLPAFEAARARRDEQRQFQADAEAALADLLNASGGGHRVDGETRQVHGYPKLATALSVRVHPAGRQVSGELIPTSASIQLRGLDIDTARDVLRLLRGRARRQENAE